MRQEESGLGKVLAKSGIVEVLLHYFLCTGIYNRKARRIRNPRTGEALILPPQKALKITAARSAKLAIAPLQDVMGFGSDTRMNAPGMPTGQWRIRFGSDSINQMDTKWLSKLNWVYKRF